MSAPSHGKVSNTAAKLGSNNLLARYERGCVSGAVSSLSRVAGLVLDSPSNEFVLEEVPVVTPNGDVVRIR